MTGLDLVPRLLEAGQTKAQAEGLEIDWREGDAEDLRFEDGSFDRVLSTFGHMFAPRHRRNRRRDGPRVSPGRYDRHRHLDTRGCGWWDLRGSRVVHASASDYASPPIWWGREAYVRAVRRGRDRFHVRARVNWIVWDSVEGFAEFFLARFGPMVTARAMLGERFGELRERVVEVWKRAIPSAARDLAGSAKIPGHARDDNGGQR